MEPHILMGKQKTGDPAKSLPFFHFKRPAWRGRLWRLAAPAGEAAGYPNSCNTDCGTRFDWARIAVDACTSIWFLVNCDISPA